MKFDCNKQDLCEAIGNVSKATAVKSTITALEGIKIKINGNIMQLTGYDLELGIKTDIAVNSDEDGEFVISSKLFNDIIRKMPSERIFIEVDDNLGTSITDGNVTNYDIRSISSEEYPELPEFDNEGCFKISQSTLKNMINQTIYSVAVTDNKPILTGELFDIEDGQFNLVAIDGFRLAVRTEKISSATDYNFVVPAKALREISALLKEDGDDECTISVSKKHIIFDISGYKVISRLLEGEYHNYKSSIPANSQTEVIIKTKDFIQSLDRCSLIINDKIKPPVICNFDNGSLKISCTTSIGKFNDAFPIEITGPAVNIGFNCKFLLDALKATESDKVKILMNGGLSPIKIVPLEGNEYTFLVLPVRLRAE